MDSMTFPNGRPSIGIIPLGTGNDLSRSLNWGGKYKSKPLTKFLMDIGKADKVTMDRWTLEATVDPNLIEESSDADEKLVCEINIFFLILQGPIVYFIEGRSPSRHKWRFCI